jgi:cell division protein FtsI (penicillin-binding protein 3)
VLVVVLVAFSGIGARLVQLQGLDAARYRALARAQRITGVTIPAERGAVFDRSGASLALSVPAASVYADPRRIDDPAGVAARLAPMVGVDADRLRGELARRDRAFVWVARKVDAATRRRVAAAALPGVGFVEERKRHYPAGPLAAPVLGFVGTDDQGLAGLEAAYDEVLSGRPGRRVDEVDPRGRVIPDGSRVVEQARRGTDLVLTLDRALQYEVERILREQVAAAGALSGMAVVRDVRTGDVLVMATVAGAHAPGAGGDDRGALRNAPLVTVFEPGSTAKVIPIAAAMERGLVRPEDTFVVPDAIRVADGVYRDHEPHPTEVLSVRQILGRSSNVGTILVARRLGPDGLDSALRRFGLGRPTGLAFPGEAAGIVPARRDYTGTSMGSLPVGYGVAVTAMQMVDVYATIANGGRFVPPRLVEAEIGPDGRRRARPRAPARRVLSERTSAALTDMLTTVVEEGTGRLAAVPGYRIAGKTGTARKVPYATSQRYMASFAGFAPAARPRYAAIVVLEVPEDRRYYGGEAAAPAFARILAATLASGRVAPDLPPGPGVTPVP